MHLGSSIPILTAISALSVCAMLASAAAGQAPHMGCYVRVYDPKHLSVHPRLLVRKVTLVIEPLRPQQLASGHGDIVANADLRVWARGYRPAFTSYGACREREGGFDCVGHNQANEHRNCARPRPGVNRCRSPGNENRFRLDVHPEVVLIKIPSSLELPADDTGPYLNLMSSDREITSFVTRRGKSCR